LHTHIEIEIPKPQTIHVIKRMLYTTKCIRMAYLLARDYDISVKELIREAMMNVNKERIDFSINLLTLASLFHSIGVPWRKLKWYLFTKEDLNEIVAKLQPISFKIGLKMKQT